MAGLDAAEALDDDPDVERQEERDERLEGHVDVQLAPRFFERVCEHGAPLGVDLREPIPQLVAVPRSAVVELDSVPIVFVATDREGEFRVVLLTVARHTETTTWVESGLVNGKSDSLSLSYLLG